LPLDRPAGNVLQRRRTQRFAGAQAEARVMPRAADGIADDEPLAERAAVMRALRADRADLVTDAYDEHALAFDAADDLTAGGKGRFVDSGRKIGLVGVSFGFHIAPPLLAGRTPTLVPRRSIVEVRIVRRVVKISMRCIDILRGNARRENLWRRVRRCGRLCVPGRPF